MSEDIRTHRLFSNEKEYLENYFDNKFSEYVHNSFKRDIELTKNNKKKNKIQRFSTDIIMMALGSFFLFNTPTQGHLFSMILLFLLGMFFSIWGIVSLYLNIKEVRKK